MAASVSAIFFDLGDTLIKTSASTTWLPGAKAALSSLKSKGFRLGIISNTGNLQPRAAILNILPPDFDINNFESQLVLFSSEVGVEKPKRQIFELAVSRSAVPARSCMYVSENIVETLVAQQVGMRSIRIKTGSDDIATLSTTIADYLQAVA